MSEINIRIKDDKADVSILKENNEMISKEVYTDDLVYGLKSKDDFYESPFLPGEYGVHKIIKNGNSEEYWFSEPAKEIEIKYDYEKMIEYLEDIGTDTDIIDMVQDYTDIYVNEECRLETISPIILWKVVAKRTENEIIFTDTKAFALKTPILNKDTPVYCIPFENVYDSGEICWGDVVLRSHSIRSIQGLSTLFYNSYFNSDLGGEQVSVDFNGAYFTNPFCLHLKMAKMAREGEAFEKRLDYLNECMERFDFDTTVGNLLGDF